MSMRAEALNVEESALSLRAEALSAEEPALSLCAEALLNPAPADTLSWFRIAAASMLPRSLTPASLSALAAFGRNAPAMSLCTSSVSVALQAAVYWVFASIRMGMAISKSAALSTYVWQIPSE